MLEIQSPVEVAVMCSHGLYLTGTVHGQSAVSRADAGRAAMLLAAKLWPGAAITAHPVHVRGLNPGVSMWKLYGRPVEVQRG